MLRSYRTTWIRRATRRLGFANPLPLWRDEPALEAVSRRDDKSRAHRAQKRVSRAYHPRLHGERIARLSGCCCVARGCCCCCGLRWRSSGGARRVHVAGHAHERGRSVLTTMRTHAATARLEYPPCRRTHEHCSLYPDFICHFMVALIIYFFSRNAANCWVENFQTTSLDARRQTAPTDGRRRDDALDIPRERDGARDFLGARRAHAPSAAREKSTLALAASRRRHRCRPQGNYFRLSLVIFSPSPSFSLDRATAFDLPPRPRRRIRSSTSIDGSRGSAKAAEFQRTSRPLSTTL